MIICALAGISWGANLIPVQKNGKAVSMVFDISYSMEAQDAPESMTRLEAAANYAKEILKKIPDVRVSVVLSKGKGTIAIPLTEDKRLSTVILLHGSMDTKSHDMNKDGFRDLPQTNQINIANKWLWQAKNGMQVTVLEREAQVGGCLQTFRRGAALFDTGFHYVGALGEGESLNTLFSYFDLLDLPWIQLDEECFDEDAINETGRYVDQKTELTEEEK